MKLKNAVVFVMLINEIKSCDTFERIAQEMITLEEDDTHAMGNLPELPPPLLTTAKMNKTCYVCLL